MTFFSFTTIRRQGFSLIELLVAIAIIGVLVTVALVSYSSSRAAARDEIRQADLAGLEVALALYKQQYGEYPTACGGVTGNRWAGSETYTGSIESCPDDYIDGLVPEFMEALPREPGPEKHNKGYIYQVSNNRQSYKVLAHHSVEKRLITTKSDDYARYPATCPNSLTGEADVYAIFGGPNSACW